MSAANNIQVGSVEAFVVVFLVRCFLCDGQGGVVESVVLKHPAADPWVNSFTCFLM
jgi:hypothetical protein